MRGRNGGGGNNNNNKNKIPNRNQTFDSNGPEIRVRGNAHQIFEKYQAMAREATTAGDRITAESYFQHAEHYFRVIAASGGFHRPQEPWGENEGDDQGQGGNGAGQQGGGPQAGGQPGGGHQGSGGHQGGGQYATGQYGPANGAGQQAGAPQGGHQGGYQGGQQGGTDGRQDGRNDGRADQRGDYRGQDYRATQDPATADQPEIIVPAKPEIKE